MGAAEDRSATLAGGAAEPRRPPSWRRHGVVLALVLATVVATAWDLYGPVRTDIRVFDPDEVARLDTVMWRSYYERKPLALFFQLAELMRGQFHFPVLRSFQVAGMAAQAAFAFKDGHGRADYVQALPLLDSYYRAIHAISRTPFDIHRTAELELEWWIIHRERLRHPPGDLESALAEAAAALYGVPPASLAEYARERAKAMVIRDTRATVLRESDWGAIREHLVRSWRSLSAAVRPAT